MSEIAELIQRIARQEVPVITKAGTVVSVDKDKQTCKVEPVDDSATLFGVRLRAGIEETEQGMMVYPKVDSTVLVTIIDNNEQQAFVSAVTEIDEVLIQLESTFKVASKDGEVHLNGDNKGALAVIADLVSRYNKIEKDINDLKTKIGGWTPVANDGGAALKTALSSWYGSTLSITSKSDIENPKVKQGDGQ